MPIPKLNSDGVLPPYNGDPDSMTETSPYPATTRQLCEKFATSPERVEILKGFLGLRSLMGQLQVNEGFQWVDGCFLEDDSRATKPPDHIQVVTFCKPSPVITDPEFADLAGILTSRQKTRSQFRVDHMPVLLTLPAEKMIDYTRYWCNLLSHQRETDVWKGMLKIELNTATEDNAALLHLNSLEGA